MVRQAGSESGQARYTFGDIIAFPRKRHAYKHYAIYVGGTAKPIQNKKENEDIFHFTGDAPNRRCEFTQLTGDEGTHKKDNYLDNDTNIKVRSDEEIIEVIDKLYRNCGEYDKLKSNCEHLATFIRYGGSVQGHSLQGSVQASLYRGLSKASLQGICPGQSLQGFVQASLYRDLSKVCLLGMGKCDTNQAPEDWNYPDLRNGLVERCNYVGAVKSVSSCS
ncbi:uncharacterized protein [Oncorhynchus clarkii lewisi]|uniref:uncharacterized protein n=1 Tax=Oncorhynchus clarkii lewisi TaxID=490388 RepID=UPI0039B93BAE